MPAGPGVRVDTALESGERVPPDYDPLVAKLLVVDADRDAAIVRLRRVLDEVEISGIQTTLPFHRFVASHAGFRAGELSTGWVAEEWEPAVESIRQAALGAAVRVAAATATVAGREGTVSPTGTAPSEALDGWRQAAREEAVDRWPG